MKMGMNLEASLAKIDRAEKHLKELESELQKLQDVAPFEVSIGEMNADRVVPVTVSLREFGFAPISMIAGDFIQNLRASLDYVVAAAAEVTPGVNVMRYHQFPIFSTPTKFNQEVANEENRAKERKALHGLPSSFVEVVRSVQPFGSDVCYSLEPIRDISNTDKHRLLLPSSAILRGDAAIEVVPLEAVEEIRLAESLVPPLPGIPTEILTVKVREGFTGIDNVAVGSFGEAVILSPPFDGNAGMILSLSQMANMVTEVRQLLRKFAAV